MKIPLVDTEDAVTYLITEGRTRKEVARLIYSWAREGRVINYGGGTRGSALWNLGELHIVGVESGMLSYNRLQAVLP